MSCGSLLISQSPLRVIGGFTLEYGGELSQEETEGQSKVAIREFRLHLFIFRSAVLAMQPDPC